AAGCPAGEQDRRCEREPDGTCRRPSRQPVSHQPCPCLSAERDEPHSHPCRLSGDGRFDGGGPCLDPQSHGALPQLRAGPSRPVPCCCPLPLGSSLLHGPACGGGSADLLCGCRALLGTQRALTELERPPGSGMIARLPICAIWVESVADFN